MPLKCIHIDPTARTVELISVEDGLKPLQAFFKGGLIESAGRLPNRDVLYVDEEGLYQNYKHGFRLIAPDFVTGGLVGPGLLVGTGRAGASADCITELEYVRRAVYFFGVE